MIPRATYRLQFNRQLTFADAAALAPYLAQLGVSHLYASPWLTSRAGSEHGYDIIDHAAFNPELGGEAGFEELHAALTAKGLGQILDFVPNHMGIAQADNSWWLDVLEWGRASPCADWFDIDWMPADRALRNKVLLPFLGDHYGKVLERGELELRFDPASGTFSVWYFGHRFPLAPHTYAVPIRAGAAVDPATPQALEMLAQAAEQLRIRAGTTAAGAAHIREQAAAFQARLAADDSLHTALQRGAAALAVQPDQPATGAPLHHLLERQAYRLAYWRVAADEINYRRFFDINGLAALRVENPEVFTRIHTLVSRLLEEGKLDGLRIDHIDGLFDPAQYCRRLRRLVRRPFYLVVEKILARHERLRANWPIEGTTGYEFLNQVNGLLVDARSERSLTRTYERFVGTPHDFDGIAQAAKKQIMRTRLSGELHVLARQLHRIAQRHPRTRDYTLQGLTHALEAVVAAFPVYRTYVDVRGADADDRRDIAWAVAQARKRWDGAGSDILEFLQSVLTTDLSGEVRYGRRRVLRFAMQFQQYTSPVMAKGYEDTALYRYHRLAGLNEVGSDPRQFGLPVAAFHRANQDRARHWPHAMLSTATHDTKRGEDVRARLAALSEVAPEWATAVRHWARLNRPWKQSVDDQPAPSRNDEYLLYQTLVGAWPVEWTDGTRDERIASEFVARVQAYMTKALREGKLESSWSDPNLAYEEATSGFIGRILDRESGRLFLDAFLPLQRRVAELGVHKSLVQLVLKLTCPGIPDIYQGCELWDLNLVDPDNRGAVDFTARSKMVAHVQAWTTLSPPQQMAQLGAWHEHWQDGAIKLHVLHRLLRLRAEEPQLFFEGTYRPLELPGAIGDGAIAFERIHGGRRVVVAAILRTQDAETSAGGLARAIPPAEGKDLVDVLSGARVVAAAPSSAETLLTHLPVAVLLEQGDTHA
ncbi:MAG TPA: malto-oligosyltrehalose synthase [Rhodanobacteraceae bacterium]|nr:malto-oligosyltrehalose synthase [Rhodanobacteraceae bacterium]